jgi:Phage Mu protein F like protein
MRRAPTLAEPDDDLDGDLDDLSDEELEERLDEAEGMLDEAALTATTPKRRNFLLRQAQDLLGDSIESAVLRSIGITRAVLGRINLAEALSGSLWDATGVVASFAQGFDTAHLTRTMALLHRGGAIQGGSDLPEPQPPAPGATTVLEHVRFDAPYWQASAYAERRGADLVRDVDQATREAIRSIVRRAQADGVTVQRQAHMIRQVVGLTESQANAVVNFETQLIAAGVEGEALDRGVERYRHAQVRRRAETIARTETLTASHQGQLDLWGAARARSYLPDTARRRWIISDDDRLCPECLLLEDATAPLGEPFRSPDGWEGYAPGRHPQCRCGMALQFSDDPEERTALVPIRRAGLDHRRAVEPERRTFDFVASIEDVDRDSEVILLDGLDITNFMRNPVLLRFHDPGRPIGKVVDLHRATIRGVPALVGTAELVRAGVSADADEAWALLRAGVGATVSIGFRSYAQGPPMVSGQRGVTHTKSELLEVSLVALPSCSGCLVTATSNAKGVQLMPIMDKTKTACTCHTRAHDDTKSDAEIVNAVLLEIFADPASLTSLKSSITHEITRELAKLSGRIPD